MLVQLFAFVLCVTAVAVVLMVERLPEHRKLAAGIESTETAVTQVAEPNASPRVRRDPCEGYHGKNRWNCRRAMARAGVEVDDDQPHEEPELD